MRASRRPWRWSSWSSLAPRTAPRRGASVAFGIECGLRAADGRGVEAVLAQPAQQRVARAVQRADVRRARLAHRAQDAEPVGVVREHEAAIEAAPPPGAADAQEPGDERLLRRAEAL